MTMRLALLFVLPTGCATSLSLHGGPSLDGAGKPGAEGRVELAAAGGSPDFRMYTSIAGGGGRAGSYESSHGAFAFEGGVEGGRDHRWAVGGLLTSRFFLHGADTFAGGTGASAQYLYRFKRAGGENGAYAIGPRFVTEVSWGGPRDTLVIVQFALVLRWITFDTTGMSY